MLVRILTPIDTNSGTTIVVGVQSAGRFKALGEVHLSSKCKEEGYSNPTPSRAEKTGGQYLNWIIAAVRGKGRGTSTSNKLLGFPGRPSRQGQVPERTTARERMLELVSYQRAKGQTKLKSKLNSQNWLFTRGCKKKSKGFIGRRSLKKVSAASEIFKVGQGGSIVVSTSQILPS